jgi:hypothetical protein
VDSHANADRLAGWPGIRNECPLHVDCPGHAGRRRREHREERVALGVDLIAAMRGEGGPDEPMVIGEDLRVRIAEAQKHRRGTLDVGKEEGERLRGQCLGLPWGRC